MEPHFRYLAQALGALRWGLPPPVLTGPGASPLDGARLVDLARRHKVREALAAFPAPLNPVQRLALQKDQLRRRQVNQRLVEEWAALSRAFSAQGHRLMVLKGPALALQWAGDPLGREFRDLDLLSDHDRPLEALPLFAARGYAPKDFDPGMDPRAEALYLKALHHLVFEKADESLYLELHGRLNKNNEELFFSPRHFLDRAVSSLWQGQELWLPHPSDHAAYVVFHAESHCWCLLSWVADAAALALNRPGLDWAAEEPLWADRGLLPAARTGAALVEALWPALPLDPVWRRWAAEGRRAAARLSFAKRNLRRAGRDLMRPLQAARFRWQYLGRDHWWFLKYGVDDQQRWTVPAGWEFVFPFLQLFGIVVRRLERWLSPRGRTA